MRAFGFHVDEAGRFFQAALGANDEPVLVIGTAIGHIIALRTADLISGEVCRREKFDFGDDDCLVAGCDGVGRRVFELVRGYEEGIGRGVEDAGFVEIGSAVVFD